MSDQLLLREFKFDQDWELLISLPNGFQLLLVCIFVIVSYLYHLFLFTFFRLLGPGKIIINPATQRNTSPITLQKTVPTTVAKTIATVASTKLISTQVTSKVVPPAALPKNAPPSPNNSMPNAAPTNTRSKGKTATQKPPPDSETSASSISHEISK